MEKNNKIHNLNKLLPNPITFLNTKNPFPKIFTIQTLHKPSIFKSFNLTKKRFHNSNQTFNHKNISTNNKNFLFLYKTSQFQIKYQNNSSDPILPSNTEEKNLKSSNYNSFDINTQQNFKISDNPYFNKNDSINLDKKEKEKIEKTVSLYVEKLESLNFDNMEIHDILDLISKLLRAENQDMDIWYKTLNQFNELLCTHRISKKDILNFLELVNFFKPKILEKKILPKDVTQIGSENLLSKRHEEEYFKLTTPKDLFGQFALHIKKNLNTNVLSKLLDIRDKFKNRENLDENIDDLLGLYTTLFKNIENKIIDDIRNGRVDYTYGDTVTLIKSFSCAQEGTNMFYELLMRKIVKNLNELNLEEIEIILNYLPHELYNNKEFQVDTEEKYVEVGRTKSVSEFYNNVYDRVIQNIDKSSDELFLNLFQGCLKVKFVDIDVIGAFLLNFDSRILNGEKNKKFVFDFLQILTYFIRNDIEEKFVGLLDFDIIWKSIYEPFIARNFESFNFKEITTIFWVMFHFKGISLERIKFFETLIKKILLGYVNDPKSKIDTMGYETHLRYYDNYNIDPYDVEALKFFIEENKEYKGELKTLLGKVLKCINLENTHPMSRKIFNF